MTGASSVWPSMRMGRCMRPSSSATTSRTGMTSGRRAACIGSKKWATESRTMSFLPSMCKVTAVVSPGFSNRKPLNFFSMRRRMEKKFKGFLLEKPGLTTAVTLHIEGKKLMVRLSVAHFFDPMQAALRPDVIPVLDVVADELGRMHRPIRIEGHTDDAPVITSRYRDNWDLSASRAASVTSYIERAHRIPGNLLSAAGYGDSRPIASNDTAAGRELNRRIDLVIEVRATDNLDAIAR